MFERILGKERFERMRRDPTYTTTFILSFTIPAGLIAALILDIIFQPMR